MKPFSLIRSGAVVCAVAFTGLGLLPGTAPAGSGHTHTHEAAGTPLSGVIVSAAYSPKMAPGVKTAAVYLSLDNAGGETVDLVAVESAAFARGHMHKSSTINGLMSMEPVAQIAVPAKTRVLFEPGGLHIMLTGAQEPLEIGDSFAMTLVFGSGDRLEVPVAVVKPGAVPSHDHGSMTLN